MATRLLTKSPKHPNRCSASTCVGFPRKHLQVDVVLGLTSTQTATGACFVGEVLDPIPKPAKHDLGITARHSKVPLTAISILQFLPLGLRQIKGMDSSIIGGGVDAGKGHGWTVCPDTLTRLIREKGAMAGCIAAGDGAAQGYPPCGESGTVSSPDGAG